MFLGDELSCAELSVMLSPFRLFPDGHTASNCRRAMA